MIKRIFIVTIICLAALLTLTVSLSMAQQELNRPVRLTV